MSLATRVDGRDLMLGALGVLLVAAAALGPVLHRSWGGVAWLALIAVWAAIVWLATRLGRDREARPTLIIILIAAAAMRVPLLLEAPYLSSDMYRYVWDGRVQKAGVNPYAHLPAADEVRHLRDTAIYPNINRADYAPTIYPPTAQVFFRAVVAISDSLLAMKLALLACEALAICALIGLLRDLGMPVTRVTAFAWHPLPAWEIAGNGHIDALLLLLMTGSLLVYIRGRVLPAGVIAAAAVFVKPTALLMFPVFWRPWNLALAVILVAAGAILYVPYLSAGGKVLGYLGGYVAEEQFASGGGFRYLGLIERLTGPIPNGAAIYAGFAGVILAAVALRIGFRRDRSPQAAVEATCLLLTLFVLLLTPHYPWYYLVLAVPLVTTGALTPWVLMTGGFVLYDVIERDTLPPFLWRDSGLHLAAVAAFAYDRFKPALPAMGRHEGALAR